MKSPRLAEFLTQKCKEKGLSLRRLSIEAGLSPAAVHSIIYRKYKPSLFSLNQIADYLGVKRQYLWELAGLVEEDVLVDKDSKKDPRIACYLEKLTILPESARELIIGIIGDIIDYHLKLQASNTSAELLQIETEE